MTDEELAAIKERHALIGSYSIKDSGPAELAFVIREQRLDVATLIAEVERLRATRLTAPRGILDFGGATPGVRRMYPCGFCGESLPVGIYHEHSVNDLPKP